VFRHEWSVSALAAALLNPADLTIIYTSGHGDGFSRALAKVLTLRRRPYVTLIAGIQATFSGPQREYFENACAIAPLNSAVRDRVVAAGFRADKIALVRLGADTNHFTPSAPAVGSRGRPTLLYVGRLVEGKGADQLIRAAASVRNSHPDLVVKIVGPPSEPSYFTMLQLLVADLELGDCVQFLGPVGFDALPDIYRSASLFVLPSSGEGYPMVVAESIASGTPVIAYNNSGGPADIITNGVDGLLVDPGELSTAIDRLLSDPSRLAAMRLAARRAALDRNSALVTNGDFEDLLSRALEYRHRAARA
jgi:glycosyltransferase involved in cell wall biosynthesis